jgi:hypothetical protein
VFMVACIWQMRHEHPVLEREEPRLVDMTCYGCADNQTCPFRWDLYNTNGDCLAEK